MTDRPGNWTLTAAARLLEEPQHRLIYLCEEGVVDPDVEDAGGRGSSRRFSNRNLLEFAVSIDRVNREDASAMVGLQRNAASAHAEPGLLCEMERCLLYFYRYLAQRLEQGVRGA